MTTIQIHSQCPQCGGRAGVHYYPCTEVRSSSRIEVGGTCAKCDALAAQLAAAERDADTLLGMIRHQRDVLRECLPYLNESMAGRRPGRSADDIRAAVNALTADAELERKP